MADVNLDEIYYENPCAHGSHTACKDCDYYANHEKRDDGFKYNREMEPDL